MTTFVYSVTPLANVIIFQTIRGTSSTTTVGPVQANLDTVLTNTKAGPPGRHFTKKRKDEVLFGIYQEGLLAQEALKRFDGMSELEIAELELSEAQAAHDEASDSLKTNYSRKLFDGAEDADAKLSAAQDKVDALRKTEAKRKALDDAKAKIKKQVSDAIAKRRGH